MGMGGGVWSVVANDYISRKYRAGENRGEHESEQFALQKTKTEVPWLGLRGKQIHQKLSIVAMEFFFYYFFP